ncbi:MAG TPA: chemotaxis protein CheA [Polyangiaceae bacterium]|jgi:two-component system chemotaxis sensor kinase CheA|nr:chemotaxis protein CheA [Polyangiaceae bacterium]
MSIGDEDIFREFLIESTENLDQLDRDFVALESNPTARERLGGIFRTIHTIKGTSGFLGLSKLEALTHSGESVLSRLRDGELVLTPEITSVLLSMVDGVRRILACVAVDTTEGGEDFSSIVEALDVFLKTPKAAAAQGAGSLGEILLSQGAITQEEVSAALEQQKSDPRKIGTILIERGAVKPDAVLDALSMQNDARAAVSDSSIRVDVGLLDKLMNLVGELVLTRNQILQVAAQGKDTSFVATSQRLNLITTELQEGVMKTRMQPIGNVWSKFPRVVRDIALACKKQVKLDMVGEETDLDRTIVEAIKDPLTHIVRNSVDHGIELPEVRVAQGKPSTGRLLLRAFHEGGQVNIEISDDGGGIDPEKIRQKAVSRGIISPERAQRMSDRESLGLIFMPGFSTAEKVTNVSGRGVGMDVVKTNVEKIGGTVDVQSKPGQGTTIKIKIPLTLAIIPALIVCSNDERFAIPQVSLLELVRLEGEQAMKSIESIHGAPVYRLRGNLLPLVHLNHTLGLPERSGKLEVLNIVVLRADDRQFGLVVDGVNDTEEIVVKPLGKELKGLSAFAGATIMGDGKVALILDVLGLAQRANVISEVRDRNLAGDGAGAETNEESKRAMLVFGVSRDGRMAMPLSMVARLEEFRRDGLERSGGQHVVQYRGEILPLIDLCGTLDSSDVADGDPPLQVVVYSEHGKSVGLVVERILDVVEQTASAMHRSSCPGILGSAVLAGKVTDLLDVHGVIRAQNAHFFDGASAA